MLKIGPTRPARWVSLSPVSLDGTAVRAIESGWFHSCAMLDPHGWFWCWSDNGQILATIRRLPLRERLLFIERAANEAAEDTPKPAAVAERERTLSVDELLAARLTPPPPAATSMGWSALDRLHQPHRSHPEDERRHQDQNELP